LIKSPAFVNFIESKKGKRLFIHRTRNLKLALFQTELLKETSLFLLPVPIFFLFSLMKNLSQAVFVVEMEEKFREL